MANWLPIEFETPEKPEMLQVAEHLGIEPDAAFGRVFRVWVWFDQQTVDGVAIGITPQMLEHAVRSPGIARAMELVGWLQVHADKIVMPNFRVHCGESAKKRYQDQRRQERRRAQTRALTDESGERDNCHAEGVTNSGPRRRPERESQKENSGPARTGSGPRDLNFLPDWPELDVLREHFVEPKRSARMQDGVFRELKPGDLQQPARIVSWHASQLTAHRPAVGGTLAHLALCLSAAEYAAKLPDQQVRKSRVALFVGLVSKQNWDPCRGRLSSVALKIQDELQLQEA